MTIAYSDPVKPFLYMESEELKGIDLDIMKAVANKAELNVNFVYMPWARALRAVRQGKVDGVLSAFCKQPAEDLLLSNESTYQTRVSVFALKAKGYSRQDLYASGSDKIISVVRGNYYIPMLSRYEHLAKVELNDIFAQGYQLLKGNMDFTVSEESWFWSQMASRKSTDKVEVVDVLDSTEVCLGFSPPIYDKKPEFIGRIDKALTKLKQEGEIQRIIDIHNSPVQAY